MGVVQTVDGTTVCEVCEVGYMMDTYGVDDISIKVRSYYIVMIVHLGE